LSGILYYLFSLVLYLRSCSRGNLDVVGLEELLEVQDLKFISLLESKELAERSIGLDNLLLHELVVLGIGADTGGDLRSAEERTLCEAEESTESIRDRSGASEDSLLLDLTLNWCGLATTTALLGLLEFSWDLLLELLHV